MHIANVERGERSLAVTWADQTVTEFPFIWLRDNAPDAFQPDAGERTLDLTTVGDCIASPATMKSALLELKRTSLLVFAGLEDEPRAAASFGDLIGLQAPDDSQPRSTICDLLFPFAGRHGGIRQPARTARADGLRRRVR